jgi:hypothetical protein
MASGNHSDNRNKSQKWLTIGCLTLIFEVEILLLELIPAYITEIIMRDYSREDLATGRVDWASMTPPEYRDLDEQALAELRSKGVPPLREGLHPQGQLSHPDHHRGSDAGRQST